MIITGFLDLEEHPFLDPLSKFIFPPLSSHLPPERTDASLPFLTFSPSLPFLTVHPGRAPFFLSHSLRPVYATVLWL